MERSEMDAMVSRTVVRQAVESFDAEEIRGLIEELQDLLRSRWETDRLSVTPDKERRMEVAGEE